MSESYFGGSGNRGMPGDTGRVGVSGSWYYLPSWTRSERPNYAEWYGANGHATADSTSTTMRHSGTVRHSSAGGINGEVEWRRSTGLVDRRAGTDRLGANKAERTSQAVALELGGAKSRRCQLRI